MGLFFFLLFLPPLPLVCTVLPVGAHVEKLQHTSVVLNRNQYETKTFPEKTLFAIFISPIIIIQSMVSAHNGHVHAIQACT